MTDRHKTGRYYDVTIKIEADQNTWLRKCKNKTSKKFQPIHKLFSSLLPPLSTVQCHVPFEVLREIFGSAFEKEYQRIPFARCGTLIFIGTESTWDRTFSIPTWNKLVIQKRQR